MLLPLSLAPSSSLACYSLSSFTLSLASFLSSFLSLSLQVCHFHPILSVSFPLSYERLIRSASLVRAGLVRHDIHFEFREYANSTEALITPPGATGGSSSADLSPRTNSNDLRSGFNPARGFPLATLFLRTVSLLANDLRSGFNLYFLLLTMV